ncbi:ABC transporter permease [Lachnospiraceae bacterium 45-P1]
MMGLLVFKEKLKQFYGKYDMYITPLVKFLVGATTFYLINSNIGFMTKLKNPLVPLVMGLVASFVPYGMTAFFAGCVILAHVSQVSLEIALIILVLMLLVMMLYYGFRPGDGYLLLLTPMMFFLKIPYVVPLVVGLSGSLVSVVPVCCGVCVYYILMYLKQNAGLLAGSSMSEMAERFIQIVKNVFGNELMWVMAAAFAAAILVVFLIKNMSVDYAWSIAIIAGVITQLIIIFIGDYNFNLPVTVGPMVLGILASVILALIYQFFVFAVDYSRTEYLQYEDDEYCYYVKAVPKIAVSAPDVKVHRIYSRKSTKRERNN